MQISAARGFCFPNHTRFCQLASSAASGSQAKYQAYSREQYAVKRRLKRETFHPERSKIPVPFAISGYVANQVGAPVKNAPEYLRPSQGKDVSSNQTPALNSPSLGALEPCGRINLLRTYSDEDKSQPPLSVTCCGCGSHLHCSSAGEPGYIPLNEYKTLAVKAEENPLRKGHAKAPLTVVCVRCRVMRQHLHALHTTFDAARYEKLIISQIKQAADAVLIVIADMSNLPHSLVPALGDRLDTQRFILVGNKVDQLPLIGNNFLDGWKSALLAAASSHSHIPESKVLHVALVSALTGYGIPGLVDFLLSRRFPSPAPVYLIGSTNVGKSSLFNRLLLSDVCKSEAREAIHRATVSNWPGTTAGLLNFPLVLMNGAKRALREEAKAKSAKRSPGRERMMFMEQFGYRYLEATPVTITPAMSYTVLSSAVGKAQESLPDLTKIPTYSRSSSGERAVTQASDFDIERLQNRFLSHNVRYDTATWAGDRGLRVLTTLIDPRHYNEKAWCFDTPGIISPDQILNYLTPEELDAVESAKSFGVGLRDVVKGEFGSVGKLLIPRTFVVRPGLSLLLGRLARLDLLKSPGPVYFTTFSVLPVHIVETPTVHSYISERASDLGPGPDDVPVEHPNVHVGGPRGVLPPLASVLLDPLESQSSLDHSSADIVLSGAGWVSVAGLNYSNPPDHISSEPLTNDEVESNDKNECRRFPHSDYFDVDDSHFHLCAWTPGRLGIAIRRPALVPGAVKLRGRRFHLMREYRGPDVPKKVASS